MTMDEQLAFAQRFNRRHSEAGRVATQGTVLTVRPPNDEGVWQLSLTVDGSARLWLDADSAVADLAITTDLDSDPAAAAEHACDLIADFDIAVSRVVIEDAAGTVDDAYDVSEVG